MNHPLEQNNSSPNAAPLLTVEQLSRHFPLGGNLWGKPHRWVKAVDGVSFALNRGETLALVGESGCGKTTTGRMVLRLIPPTAGRVLLEGTDLSGLSARDLVPHRRRMQMIFQDPYASLNPRMTAGAMVEEPLAIHRIGTPAERKDRVAALFQRVGLRPDQRTMYPHQFSGGQRQRVGIARALALDPALIVADEPVSALDVSIQAQVVNLLAGLQAERGMAYLFISHDLAVVRHLAHRVAVMYLGRLAELAPREELFSRPRHPYTQALLAAVPSADPAVAPRRTGLPRTLLGGEVPDPANAPPGCAFHPRCPLAREHCRGTPPPWREIQPAHWAACHEI
ncbi:MAG: ATP-binding cassette domain-containing protein [Deltaproteobacteria bacterium]|nr:ATP-binding cassette domain-containing protein [Deltaproteobacteria bacterium]